MFIDIFPQTLETGRYVSTNGRFLGVEFKTFCMSMHELSMKQYEHCLHPLTDNDIVRLQELKEVELYADTIQYMLQINVKLEQEIISLELMKG